MLPRNKCSARYVNHVESKSESLPTFFDAEVHVGRFLILEIYKKLDLVLTEEEVSNTYPQENSNFESSVNGGLTPRDRHGYDVTYLMTLLILLISFSSSQVGCDDLLVLSDKPTGTSFCGGITVKVGLSY